MKAVVKDKCGDAAVVMRRANIYHHGYCSSSSSNCTVLHSVGIVIMRHNKTYYLRRLQ